MEKNRIIIYALAGLLVLSLGFCLVSLLYSSIENISSQNLSGQWKAYEEKGNEALKIEEYHKKWRNIDKEFDRFKSEYLMNFDEYSKFWNELTLIINKYRLRNQPFQPKYKTLFKELYIVEMNFTVNGDYPSIKQFIHEILGQKKIILLKQVKLSMDKLGEDVAASFLMEVYLVK
jgi:Tfp pilus assembly protein PilO